MIDFLKSMIVGLIVLGGMGAIVSLLSIVVWGVWQLMDMGSLTPTATSMNILLGIAFLFLAYILGTIVRGE